MVDRVYPVHLSTKPLLLALMYHRAGRFEAMNAYRANYFDADRFAWQVQSLYVARGTSSVQDARRMRV